MYDDERNKSQRLNEMFHGREKAKKARQRDTRGSENEYVLLHKDFGVSLRGWEPRQGSYVLWVAGIVEQNYDSIQIALFNDCEQSGWVTRRPGGLYKVIQDRQFLKKIGSSGIPEHYNEDAVFELDKASREWYGGEKTQGMIIPVPLFLMIEPGEYGKVYIPPEPTAKELRRAKEMEQVRKSLQEDYENRNYPRQRAPYIGGGDSSWGENSALATAAFIGGSDKK